MQAQRPDWHALTWQTNVALCGSLLLRAPSSRRRKGSRDQTGQALLGTTVIYGARSRFRFLGEI